MSIRSAAPVATAACRPAWPTTGTTGRSPWRFPASGSRTACPTAGDHLEGTLLYWAPPGVFREFQGVLGLQEEAGRPPAAAVEFELRQDGRILERFGLDGRTPVRRLSLPGVGGEFGLRFRGTGAAGALALANGVLIR